MNVVNFWSLIRHLSVNYQSDDRQIVIILFLFLIRAMLLLAQSWHINFIMEKGHVLKFVVNGKTFDPNVGVRTFPQQTYGVSEYSPEQFHQKHTLTGDNSYMYRYEDAPEFDYASQKHYFDPHRSIQLDDYDSLHGKLQHNPVMFHRKKGRLSEFMDKNGWMAPVIPIMGHERGPEARRLEMRDRAERIKNLKLKPKFDNKVALKPHNSKEYKQTMPTIMSEKMRIRKKRLSLHDDKAVFTPRQLPPCTPADPYNVEEISEKMATKNMDFYSTNSTFYQGSQFTRKGISQDHRRITISPEKVSSPSKPIQTANSKRFSSTCHSGFGPFSRTQQMNSLTLQAFPKDESKMEEWKRTTCNSKWVYRPRPIPSEESIDDSFNL